MGMTKCLCVAETQNQATSILSMLRQAGISGSIVPTPRRFVNAVQGKTCSYSVEFPSRYVSAVKNILRNSAYENEIVCV